MEHSVADPPIGRYRFNEVCALVTSANFSETAQRHNFEAGWLVRDTWRTRQISGHYRQMVEAGLFTEI